VTYHAKLIKGGKIVIPAMLRRSLGLADGDTLVFEQEDDKIVIKSQEAALRELREKVKAKLKRPMSVDIYLREKWAEADGE
jgi:AbrB family transcriptional regulator (stage V sporulation protein T)